MILILKTVKLYAGPRRTEMYLYLYLHLHFHLHLHLHLYLHLHLHWRLRLRLVFAFVFNFTGQQYKEELRSKRQECKRDSKTHAEHSAFFIHVNYI